MGMNCPMNRVLIDEYSEVRSKDCMKLSLFALNNLKLKVSETYSQYLR